MTTGPTAKRAKFDFSEDTTVLVGPKEKRFTVHKSVLVADSHFFKAALSRVWKESQEKQVKLPDENPEIFSIYLQWIYSRVIVVEDGTPNLADTEAIHAYTKKNSLGLVKLYCLGDLLGATLLRNSVIDELLLKIGEGKNHGIGITAVTFAFNSLPAGCTLRRLFVDFYVSISHVGWLEEYGRSIPSSMLFETVLAYAKRVSNLTRPSRSSLRPKCEYHEHNDSFPKCE